MKEYQIRFSIIAKEDLKRIISYLRYDLVGDSIANKYEELFNQMVTTLKVVARSMAVLDKKITGHNNIRKINVKNFVAFYTIEGNIAIIIRIGHTYMNWKNYLKDY